MKQLFRVNKIAVIFWMLLTSAAIHAQVSSPVPANMPFRHGLGHENYEAKCALCHGGSLQGTEQGPPLFHRYYVPSHHGDAAFYRAIRSGTRQHHWNFGDMPPVAGVGENDARAIVEFIRWFQRASKLY